MPCPLRGSTVKGLTNETRWKNATLLLGSHLSLSKREGGSARKEKNWEMREKGKRGNEDPE